MKPEEVRALRERLHLTQEVFARILGVSFATVNRWENGKSEPSGDYARVLQTLMRLTAADSSSPSVNWQRVGALSAMAAVAGFSPLLTLGAALAPLLIAHLPSWSDSPFGDIASGKTGTRLRENPVKRVVPKALLRTTPTNVRVKWVSAKSHSRPKGSAPRGAMKRRSNKEER